MSDPGTLKFRAARVIDANVGFDTANTDSLTADRGVYISNDGLRRVEHLLNIGHKKARLWPGNLDDHLAAWVPVDNTDINLDSEIISNMDKILGNGKRKRYESSVSGVCVCPLAQLMQTQDDPMGQWCKEKQFFLDETLRRHGLGDSDLTCAHCENELQTREAGLPGDTNTGAELPRIFRCSSCGEFLQCQACCIAHHQKSPLHFLELRVLY
jgi:hypothetical protein